MIHAGVVVDGNPIEKIKLAVRQNGDQLVLIPLHRRAVGGAASVSTAVDGGGTSNDTTMLNDGGTNAATLNDVDDLLSQNYLLQQRLDDTRNELSMVLANHMRYMVTMNTNIRRIAAQPFNLVAASSSTPKSNRASTSTNRTTAVKLSGSPLTTRFVRVVG